MHCQSFRRPQNVLLSAQSSCTPSCKRQRILRPFCLLSTRGVSGSEYWDIFAVVASSVLSCRFMEASYRRPLIAQEVLRYNTDIVCLQEVDEKAFFTYFYPVMKHAGVPMHASPMSVQTAPDKNILCDELCPRCCRLRSWDGGDPCVLTIKAQVCKRSTAHSDAFLGMQLADCAVWEYTLGLERRV